MRVISGSARRLLLKTPEGMDTRPTTDRIKETLFNMLNPELLGCRFLDLYSGSGGIGIEALSRGAAEAVFVEQASEALNCIRENLETTHLQEHAVVYACDCVQAIRQLDAKGNQFDFVFMDPPYRQKEELRVLEALGVSGLLHNDSIIIVEAALDTHLDEAENLGFHITKVKKYKTNQHFFLQKESVGEEV